MTRRKSDSKTPENANRHKHRPSLKTKADEMLYPCVHRVEIPVKDGPAIKLKLDDQHYALYTVLHAILKEVHQVNVDNQALRDLATMARQQGADKFRL